MKGQSSVEFITVIGVALLLAAPFVIEGQKAMINLATDSEDTKFQASLNDLGNIAEQVTASGDKSARTTQLRVPDNIENVYSKDQALVFEMNRGGNPQNFSQIFPVKINTNITASQGLKTIHVSYNSSELSLNQQ